jgi:hypothetical protein
MEDVKWCALVTLTRVTVTSVLVLYVSHHSLCQWLVVDMQVGCQGLSVVV